MFCRNCGKNLNKDQKFCSECGTPVDNFEQNQQQNGFGGQYQYQTQYQTQFDQCQNQYYGQNQNDVQYSPKSRIAAGLLGIFLEAGDT